MVCEVFCLEFLMSFGAVDFFVNSKKINDDRRCFGGRGIGY